MPEIRIVTEVAGRVCVLPVETGSSVSEGDDIAFVEAMKMEIPVASPAAGKLKSILVRVDDVVAEGQVLAIAMRLPVLSCRPSALSARANSR